jgi:hypothetical protein
VKRRRRGRVLVSASAGKRDLLTRRARGREGRGGKGAFEKGAFEKGAFEKGAFDPEPKREGLEVNP